MISPHWPLDVNARAQRKRIMKRVDGEMLVNAEALATVPMITGFVSLVTTMVIGSSARFKPLLQYAIPGAITAVIFGAGVGVFIAARTELNQRIRDAQEGLSGSEILLVDVVPREKGRTLEDLCEQFNSLRPGEERLTSCTYEPEFDGLRITTAPPADRDVALMQAMRWFNRHLVSPHSRGLPVIWPRPTVADRVL
jgi:hypothetical protein